MPNANKPKNKTSPQPVAEAPARGRGRPRKPLDMHKALELMLLGASAREQARVLGCDPKTLMAGRAEQIAEAEARISGFLKLQVFHLAIVERYWPALEFLLQEVNLADPFLLEPNGLREDGKWLGARRKRAVRVLAKAAKTGSPPKAGKVARVSLRKPPRQPAPRYRPANAPGGK